MIARRATIGVSALLVVIGVVVVVQSILVGGPLGVLVGALLALVGVLRIVLATRS